MTKKKILFAANLESFFTKFLIPQLKYFKDKGYEIHVAAKSENMDIPYCDKKFDVDFARSLNIKQNIRSYKQMKKIFKDEHYDIVSCHTPFGAAITRLAFKHCKIKETKMVYMAHGFHFYKGAPLLNWLLFYPAEKYLARFTDTLITINLDDFEIAKKKFKTDVRCVNGIGLDTCKFDFDMSEKEKMEYRNSLGLEKDDFVMIYPAELLPRKRQEWLIKSLSTILKENKHFKLLLPGKDSMHGKCQNIVTKNNLNDQVLFLGFRKDVPKLIKISNLALSSSKQEGLPVNIMEAMYCGLPVIATDCRGNRDLITNGENGYIIGMSDSKSLCDKVLSIAKLNSFERENIKFNNQEKVKKYLLNEVLNDIIKNTEPTLNDHTDEKSIIYLRSTSIINDSRATKEITCYLESGYKVIVLCWNRQKLDNLQLSIGDNKANIIAYNKESEYGKGLKNINSFLSFQLWLYKKLKELEKEYDIIHACDFDTAYIANKIAKKKNKKLVYDIYDYYVDCHSLGQLKKMVEKRDINIINNADCTIICTEQRKKQISKATPKKLLIVHNSPAINNLTVNRECNPKKIKICYVGILQDDRMLIELAEKIKGDARFEFLIGGFGKYESYFLNLSKKFDNVKFYGQMNYNHVLELENECDILFATYNPKIKNHKFSAPNKLYEAMALGKPIIVCNGTGVDEIVKKEKIGWVINYSADEFIDCIKNISCKKYEMMSNNAKKLYVKKYSWDVMKKKIIDMIDDL